MAENGTNENPKLVVTRITIATKIVRIKFIRDTVFRHQLEDLYDASDLQRPRVPFTPQPCRPVQEGSKAGEAETRTHVYQHGTSESKIRKDKTRERADCQIFEIKSIFEQRVMARGMWL